MRRGNGDGTDFGDDRGGDDMRRHPPNGRHGLLRLGITLVAGIVAGMLAANITGQMRLPMALAAGGIYLLLALILRGLIFGNLGEKPWITVIVICLGGHGRRDDPIRRKNTPPEGAIGEKPPEK